MKSIKNEKNEVYMLVDFAEKCFPISLGIIYLFSATMYGPYTTRERDGCQLLLGEKQHCVVWIKQLANPDWDSSLQLHCGTPNLAMNLSSNVLFLETKIATDLSHVDQHFRRIYIKGTFKCRWDWLESEFNIYSRK